MAQHRPKNDSYREGDTIYALEHPGTAYIKLGKTGDFGTRFSSLRSLYGALNILGIMPGYTEMEAFVHLNFDHLRVPAKAKSPQRCEWFAPAPELRAFINEYMAMPSELPRHHSTCRYSYRWVKPDFGFVLDSLISCVGMPLEFYEHGDVFTLVTVYPTALDSAYTDIYAAGFSVYSDYRHGERRAYHIRQRKV